MNLTSIKNHISDGQLKESFRLKIRKKYIARTYESRKKLINHNDFTIISNNCWGGTVYQSYGLPYNSPTVGLYIMSEDYIKFVKRLEYYTSLKLKFIDPKDSKHFTKISPDGVPVTHPVGLLDDVEIFFLHYHSQEEAFEKWTRRCERINWDKLIVKFSDLNHCEPEHMYEFDKLDYKNKVFFSSKKHNDLKSEVYIKEAQKQKTVTASQEPFGKSKYINMNDFINSL